jgi:ERCC4-type nuclease
MNNSVLLRVDNRESIIKTLLPSFEVYHVCENLECGDFIIEVSDVPFLVFERKTIKDLLASVHDGRYKHQKNRMIERYGRDKIIYIIEGQPVFSNTIDNITDVEYKVLKSCIINTQIRDKINVMQTLDVHETCRLICDIVTRIIKDPSKYVLDFNTHTPSTQNVVLYKTKAKAGKTKTEVFIQQISQINGISDKSAEAISKEFSDMKTFYETLLPLSDEQKLKLLKNIYLKDNRRINSNIAENILQYMF